MCDILQNLREQCGKELQKCGEIIAAPKMNVYVLSCIYCQDLFMHIEQFMEHMLQEHSARQNLSLTVTENSLPVATKQRGTSDNLNASSGTIASEVDENCWQRLSHIKEEHDEFTITDIKEDLLPEEDDDDDQLLLEIKDDAYEMVDSTQAIVMNEYEKLLLQSSYTCVYCNEIFTSPSSLDRHTNNKHIGMKPHKCNQCDYAATHLAHLRRHMLRHFNTRPHKCPHCDYASKRKDDLQKHVQRHIGEKSFECDICHKSFALLNNMRRHRRIHESSLSDRPHKCHYCTYSSVRKDDLQIHIRGHTGERPFICNICEKGFTTSSKLKKHKTTHKDSPI